MSLLKCHNSQHTHERAKWRNTLGPHECHIITQEANESPKVCLLPRSQNLREKNKTGYGEGNTHYKWQKTHKTKTTNSKANWKCHISVGKIIHIAIHHGPGFLYNTHMGLRRKYVPCSLSFDFKKCHSMISNNFKVSCPSSLSFPKFLKTLIKNTETITTISNRCFSWDSDQKSPLM